MAVAKSGLGIYRQTMADINGGKLLPAYCFAGPEKALRRAGVAALRRASKVSDLNYSRFEEEDGLREALALAATSPFFGGGKRLVVYSGEKLKVEEKKELVRYLADPAPWSHLVLSLTKGEEGLFPRGGMVPCPPPSEDERQRWLSGKAARMGFSLDRGGMAALVSRTVGYDLDRLELELEKLAAFASGSPLGAGDVEALVEEKRETKIFQLVDSLGERKTAAAIGILHRLLGNGEGALGILGMLAWQVRLLLEAKGYLASGLTEAEAQSRLEGHPYVLQQTIRRARRFTLDELRSGHALLCRADGELKRGADPRLTLELIILRFLGVGAGK